MKKQNGKISTLSKSVILWRYLDMSKFMDLLHYSSLFITRSDKFEDKFEGSFTESVKKQIERYYKNNDTDFSYEDFKKALKTGVFINCWHRGTKENMAMWRIYGNSTNSIAITTTVGKLEKQLEPHNMHGTHTIRKVEYINHFDDPTIDVSKYSNIFTYKHEAYKFEKEVRVILDHYPNPAVMSRDSPGFKLKVNLSDLLRSIVVSPEAPIWFYTLVYDLCCDYKIQHLIKRSELADDPI